MVDLVNQARDLTGIAGGGGGIDISLIITILALIILGGIAAGGLTWWIVSRKQFNLKIQIFERINGRFQPTKKDKAKKIKIGQGGDEAIILKKHKKILPMPVIQTGIRNYWYFISDDGEWINFGPSDFDENRKEMGAQMLDKEMRYARTSLQYMNQERYDKPGFFEKYGGMIMYAALIIVTAVGFWLLIDKMIEVSSAAASAVDSASAVLEETKRILGTLDTLKGGSGISPA